jgi:hypothetical protein
VVRRGRAQHSIQRRGIATLVLALGLLVACGGGRQIVGVVTAIDGDLQRIETFTLRTVEGEDLTFTAAPDATFHGGPLTHISDHLRSGVPVSVEYREEGDRLVATEVEDA